MRSLFLVGVVFGATDWSFRCMENVGKSFVSLTAADTFPEQVKRGEDIIRDFDLSSGNDQEIPSSEEDSDDSEYEGEDEEEHDLDDEHGDEYGEMREEEHVEQYREPHGEKHEEEHMEVPLSLPENLKGEEGVALLRQLMSQAQSEGTGEKTFVSSEGMTESEIRDRLGICIKLAQEWVRHSEALIEDIASFAAKELNMKTDTVRLTITEAVHGACIHNITQEEVTNIRIQEKQITMEDLKRLTTRSPATPNKLDSGYIKALKRFVEQQQAGSVSSYFSDSKTYAIVGGVITILMGIALFLLKRRSTPSVQQQAKKDKKSN